VPWQLGHSTARVPWQVDHSQVRMISLAGAMVIASRDFNNPDILVMVIATVLAGLLLLFAIAWRLNKRTPHVGLPTPEAAPA